jgi:hypothetical protein
VGLCHAVGIYVRCLCLLCRVSSGLCFELITCSEESYCVCMGLIVCDLETSTVRWPRSELGCSAIQKERGGEGEWNIYLGNGSSWCFSTKGNKTVCISKQGLPLVSCIKTFIHHSFLNVNSTFRQNYSSNT